MKNTKLLFGAIAVFSAVFSIIGVLFDPGRGFEGGVVWLMLREGGGQLLFLSILCLCSCVWLCWHDDREGSMVTIAGLCAMVVCWLAAAVMIAVLIGRFCEVGCRAKISMNAAGDEFSLILAIGVASAIWEEVLFRSVLQKWLVVRLGKAAGVVLVAVIFTLLHRKGGAVLFFLALSLGIASICTGSIISGVVAHAFYNFAINFAQIGGVGGGDVEKFLVAVVNMSCAIVVPLSLLLNVAVGRVVLWRRMSAN